MLPQRAPARYCGNCFFAAVGTPVELALLGLLLAARAVAAIPYDRDNSVYWFCAVAGMLWSPMIIGIPVFAIAFIALLWATAERAFGMWSGRPA